MTLHHTKEECKRLAGGRVEACRLRRISRGQPFEGAFVAAKRGATDINGDTWAGWPASQPASEELEHSIAQARTTTAVGHLLLDLAAVGGGRCAPLPLVGLTGAE